MIDYCTGVVDQAFGAEKALWEETRSSKQTDPTWQRRAQAALLESEVKVDAAAHPQTGPRSQERLVAQPHPQRTVGRGHCAAEIVGRCVCSESRARYADADRLSSVPLALQIFYAPAVGCRGSEMVGDGPFAFVTRSIVHSTLLAMVNPSSVVVWLALLPAVCLPQQHVLRPQDVKVPMVLGVMSRCPDAIVCEGVIDSVLRQVGHKLDLSLTFIGRCRIYRAALHSTLLTSPCSHQNKRWRADLRCDVQARPTRVCRQRATAVRDEVRARRSLVELGAMPERPWS